MVIFNCDFTQWVLDDTPHSSRLFCCMKQNCLIGLMHTCVSVIVAEKLLHLSCCCIYHAALYGGSLASKLMRINQTHTCLQHLHCIKTDAYQSSTHICNSYMHLFWCMAAVTYHTVISLCSKTATPMMQQCSTSLYNELKS